jgi:GT2 family glycosyltransferase
VSASGAAPDVSVIALFDRGGFEPCLPSLLAQTGVEFEVLAVVGDEAAAARVPRHERVIVVPVSNRNPALRRNAAAAKAQGRVLAFIDDDASAPPDWLTRGLAFLDRHPDDAGVGGPNLCPVDASLRELLTEMVLVAPLIGAGSRAYRGGGESAPARPGELHLVNLMVRRDWFDRVDGFNEALGYGGEDTEFIHQAARRGGRFTFDPELAVRHCRRPFGPAYFRQRFRLRRQSARLFLAYPKVYAGNLSFAAAALALPAAAALLILVWLAESAALLLLFVALYVLATIVLSSAAWRRRPILLALAPPAFFLHHLFNLAGLWVGFTEAVLSRSRR